MPRLLERDEVISRSKILVSLLISFILALFPLSIGSIESKNKAYANPVAFAGAYSFLEAAAAAAGLSVGDYIATLVGASTVATGLNLANDSGIAFGKSGAENLENLLDAADYPDYDSLSASEQESWGSRTNYDAAKFNSLCSAFGLESAYNDYQQDYVGTGGGSYEFSTEMQNKLNKIGRIGSLWAAGASNAATDVLNIIVGRTAIDDYLGAGATFETLDTSQYENFPTGIANQVNINTGTLYESQKTDGYYHFKMATGINCNWFIPVQSNNQLNVIAFSSNSFQWGTKSSYVPGTVENPSISYNCESYTYDGKTVYWAYQGRSNSEYPRTTNMQLTYNVPSISSTQIEKICWALTYGGPELNIGDVPEIDGYPETVDGTQRIYFPVVGVNNTTVWNNFITESSGDEVDLSGIIELLNRFNFTSSGDLRVNDSEILTAIQNCCNRFQFYATGQLKVHDEGIFDQLTDVQTTLNQILAKIGLSADAPDIIGEFDYPELQAKSNTLVEDISTLAPFGSMLVISETVGILSQTEQIEEPKLDVPFKFGLNQDYSVEIDLSWLDPLKPLINALLIMVLVMTLAGVTLRFVELEASA